MPKTLVIVHWQDSLRYDTYMGESASCVRSRADRSAEEERRPFVRRSYPIAYIVLGRRLYWSPAK